MLDMNNKILKNKGDDVTKNEIVLFENQNVKLEVNVKDETVWLSLEQMAKLYSRDRTVITKHINNIFKDQELDNRVEKNKHLVYFVPLTPPYVPFGIRRFNLYLYVLLRNGLVETLVLFVLTYR